MQNGENPMQYKKRLAREIITTYHNEPEAVAAQDNWEKTFSDGGIPTDIPEVITTAGTLLIDLLTTEKIVDSKSDFRRLIEEGAIKVMTETGEEKITDVKYSIQHSIILKIGKKKFIKISL
jgi:tyrosyl-tRNA synthetase